MTKKTYKTLTAAFLLALYAFIATPVSFWHQHKNCETSNPQTERQIFTKAVKTALDANCKICSHHYSVFADDAVTPVIYTGTYQSSFTDFFLIKDIPNPGYSHSNKGPPAIA